MKMKDPIERQDVINILATMQGRCTSKAALIQNSKIWQQIKDLPSAQQWIPVSKSLPPSREEVNVSICDETGDTRYNYTSHGWLTTDKEYWIVDNEINNYVVAWMPLPEPWKVEQEEENNE